MKCFFIFPLLCFSFAIGQEKSFLASNGPSDMLAAKRVELQSLITKRGGCKSNFCFAIQSSDSIKSATFDLQKYFVSNAARTLFADPNIRLALVQYGAIATTVAYMNASSTQFIENLKNAKYDAQIATSLGAPMVMCDALFTVSRVSNRVTVILGDGSNNFGSDPQFNSQIYKSRGGSLFGIALAYSQKDAFQNKLNVSVGDVAVLKKFFDIKVVLEKLVSKYCF